MVSPGPRSSAFRRLYGLLFVVFATCCSAQTLASPAIASPDLHVASVAASTTQIPQSTFFITSAEEAYSTYQMPGDGDLWPSCWADDDNLYTANGDGKAFTNSPTRFDMAVSVISGMPPNLTGRTLATDVGTNWSGLGYNRKPTGMLCIDNALYLAFQNLSTTFNDAPAASIATSTDHGVTWSWNTSAPMFGTPENPDSAEAYKFTTIFFLDYGKNSASAPDNYVYAYGLDNDFRSGQTLYLARVPHAQIMLRSAWEFFTGLGANNQPTWSSDITQKTAVLTDTRLLYPVMIGTGCPASQPVIGQGGVVYDAPLGRYLFTSWSCATHELYEAPDPWGPWSLVSSTDFGALRLATNRGQYGTSIPSKFISSDGKTLYLQSNVCCSGDSYTFSLRKVFLEPYLELPPANGQSDTNLALEQGARAISKSTHEGLLCGPDCSNLLTTLEQDLSEDDFDEEAKTVDWWGYTWPRPYKLNEVVYTTGNVTPEGGWFAGNLRVQVRQHFQWIDVAGATVTPSYPYSQEAGSWNTYVFTFPETWGDGIRVIGTPGGSSYFTSISLLSVYDNPSPGSIPTTTILTSPNAGPPAGSAVTFTANVFPAGAAGTVTFLDGTASLGNASLAGGVATFTTSSLAPGSHAITAKYNGSGSYDASTSTALTEISAGFSISSTASSAGVTVKEGATAQLALNVAVANGFEQPISFACSGLPSLATCSFSPSTITPNGSGNAASVTVTIATSASAASSSIARQSQEHRSTPSVFYALAVFGMGSLFGLAGRMRRKGNPFLLLLFATLLSVSAGSMLGCGVSPQDANATESATPLSTSKVTVSAIAGTDQQTVSFVLTVQSK